MLAFVKRWSVFLAITAICLILLTSVRHRVFPISSPKPPALSFCPALPPSPPYSPPSHDRFNWRNVTARHPLESFAQLPTERPVALPKIQYNFGSASSQAEATRKERQAAVKETFQRGWDSYKAKAWMKDELTPISGGSKTTFGGWGATLVDALDTLWIMDMKDDFEMALSAAMNIDFNPANVTVETISIFETTIRYLGGFIAAYDMTDCKDTRLLDKAVEVGDMLYAAFDTGNHMPVSYWNPQKAAAGSPQVASETDIIADLGSFSLEFTRLSQLTGDMRWYDAIQRIADVMDQQQNQTKLPGMWPVAVDLRTPDLTRDTSFSLGAMSDSTYEYFPKTYQLLGGVGQAPQYRKLYEYAMDTAINHLFFRPMVPGNEDILMTGIAHADDPSSPTRENTGQHLVCFVGGMLALGGRLFANTTHVDLGRRLADGCIWAYRHSAVGIMPEWFKMSACPSLEPCDWDETEWRAQGAQEGRPFGFTEISDPRYILRPEAIESVFYLYRITGDEALRDAAWDMFQAIDKHTRTEFANAALKDMSVPEPEKVDSMESFWMAETLKYFYLIFSEPDLISLDDFVFNTEAHPFKLRK